MKDALVIAGVMNMGAALYQARRIRVAKLTDRQCEILGLIADGYDTGQIEEELDLTRSMVRREIGTIRRRLPGAQAARAGLRDLPGIAEWAKACDTEEAAA